MNIAILGSTGSIGQQALDVVEQFSNQLHVVMLAAGQNITLLQQQVQKFKPTQVVVKHASDTKYFEDARYGDDGLIHAMRSIDLERVLIAIPGLAGILPCIYP